MEEGLTGAMIRQEVRRICRAYTDIRAPKVAGWSSSLAHSLNCSCLYLIVGVWFSLSRPTFAAS